LRATRPHSSDALAPGQRIGPFVLLAPLGAGGSGRIWAVARLGQLGFNKRMVLKVMRQDKLANPRAHERFDREACLGARLSHANLRAVHDLGSHEGRPYMALSWVDTTLAELLEHAPGRRLSADVVCWLGVQCCAALGAAHDFVDAGGAPSPIVHRDVSPGNIMLSADGHALLADLAAVVPDSVASPRAEGSRFFGSLGYASPEALRQEPLDPRADLFSLGAVLYEALAGAPAFEGDDEHNVVFQILERGAPDLRQRAPELPEALVAVIERCLERRPEQRFQSAKELSAALSACCQARSPFQLEQHTASVIREVLGAPIRAREEALHLAFQRFAPSPFERTDTLPIARAPDASAGTTLSLDSGVERDGRASEGEVSRSGAGLAISHRAPARRRPLWLALLLLAVVSSFGLWSWRASLSSRGAASAGGTGAEPPAAAPSVTAPTGTSSTDPSSPSTPSGPGTTPGGLGQTGASEATGGERSRSATPSPSGATPPESVAQALQPSTGGTATRPRPPGEPRAKRPAPPPAAPAAAPKKPFGFPDLPPNPYESQLKKAGGSAPATPSRATPSQAAPSQAAPSQAAPAAPPRDASPTKPGASSAPGDVQN
jgi:eukaryotic-like serine/threonine-protein kinase